MNFTPADALQCHDKLAVRVIHITKFKIFVESKASSLDLSEVALTAIFESGKYDNIL